MSTRRYITWLAAMVVAALVATGAETPAPAPSAVAPGEAAPAVAQPPLSPRFKQVRERINTLFAHRNDTPPPLEPRANPFRAPGAVASTPPAPMAPGEVVIPAVAEPSEASSDLTRLQESVATLKVGGTLERDGKLYLLINGKQYKDNDVIPTQVRGESVYLRVRSISRRGMTVALNDAEMTLRF